MITGASPSTPEMLATIFFSLAVLHTFLASQFQKLANRYEEGSIPENFFHLLGEVEVVFGLWAGLFLLSYSFATDYHEAIRYTETLNFTEPMFVFVIMTMAATKPVLETAKALIVGAARGIPRRWVSSETAVYFSCLTIGPLLGSLITEPAAMTLTALILKQRYYNDQTSNFFKYLTIANLFVNVSIGGVLTPFAAPPVLMVASTWHWDMSFMLKTFAWRATAAVVINALLAVFVLRKELSRLKVVSTVDPADTSRPSPLWLRLVHAGFMFIIVAMAHHPVVFVGVFLFFLGVAAITQEFQTELPLKQSLLVCFFLGGLVVLGGLQKWWLGPVLHQLSETTLFMGATGLTAITDNAALTYLGSQLEGITDAFKYSLVAGAITGGGLTVIANAPNPAGYSILQDRFGANGIQPGKLFLSALVPTLISALLLWPY